MLYAPEAQDSWPRGSTTGVCAVCDAYTLAPQVLASLVSGLALGWAHPRYCTDALRATLVGSALLGTAYSAPPLRLKRFPLLAGLCIMAVRHAHVHMLHVYCMCSCMCIAYVYVLHGHCMGTAWASPQPAPLPSQVRGALINWGFFAHGIACLGPAAAGSAGWRCLVPVGYSTPPCSAWLGFGLG